MIITSAFISVGTWLSEKIVDKGFDKIYAQATDKNFDKRFYKKIKLAAEKISKKYPDAFGGKIQFLFEKEDVFNETLKLLFFDAKVNLQIIERNFDTSTLQPTFLLEFLECLKKELYEDNFFRNILNDKNLYLTIVGINKDVKELSKISQLSLDELISIRKTLSETVNFSLEQYRKCIINDYSQLYFLGLGIESSIKKGKRKTLEELFVKPTFVIDRENIELIEDNLEDYFSHLNLNLDDIFAYEKNLVILGNPGSGKSILTKFITLKIIQGDRKSFLNESIFDRIPFRIELRNYHSFKTERSEGILNYLEQLLKVDFSFSGITEKEINQILIEKKSLVIFDGLDEIFDIQDKLAIKRDIENFVSVYPNTQIIVTSRFIGYNDAEINKEIVLTISIDKFDDQQIEQYINNWYLVEEKNTDLREKEVNDLLSKKELIDQEIISNPLLLSLIVILYRNNLKVPESKLEIYQSCTKTLVDKWDNIKKLNINLPDEIYKRKDTIFADLAFWQYNELSNRQGKVTYARAKNTVSHTLTEKLKIVDEFTAEQYAEKFLLYAEKRSLYFDNNFTHKTFLEYFTAFWIFSNIEKKLKKDKRNDLFEKYVLNSYWHIVLELLINLIDKDQADNEIIDDLINHQLAKNEKSSAFFLKVYSSIQNVSLSVFENIIEILIKDTIVNQENVKQDGDKIVTFSSSSIVFISDYYSDDALRNSINKILLKLQDSALNKTLLLSYYFEVVRHSEEVIKNIGEDHILKTFDLSTVNKDLLNFAHKLFQVDYQKFRTAPSKSFKKFIEHFGTAKSLEPINTRFSNFKYYPIALISLRYSVFNSDNKEFLKFLELIDINNISIDLIARKIFQLPIFQQVEYNSDNMIANFNSLKDPKYDKLLIAMLYSTRFRSTHDLSLREDMQNWRKNTLEKIKLNFINPLLKKDLEYILDIKNNRIQITNLIKHKYEINPLEVKPSI